MATVSGSVVNEGTVTFKDNTTTLCSNVPLNGSGQATCSIAFSTVGSHSITAQYSGSNNFKLSQSAILPQAVTYSFIGFLAPVQNPNAVNVGNTGKTYPIKWQLTDSKGSYISDLASIASLGYYPALCSFSDRQGILALAGLISFAPCQAWIFVHKIQFDGRRYLELN